MRIRLLTLGTFAAIITVGTTACSNPTAPRVQSPKDASAASDTTGKIGIYMSGYIVSTGNHGRDRHQEPGPDGVR
jgi:hypothetical protein